MQVLIAVVGDNWFKRVNFELQALSLPDDHPPHSHSQSSVPMPSFGHPPQGSASTPASETSNTGGQFGAGHPHSSDIPYGDGRPGMGDPSLHDPAAAIRWTEERLREKQRSLRSFETEFRQVKLVLCPFHCACVPS